MPVETISFSKVLSRKFYSKPECDCFVWTLIRKLPACERGKKTELGLCKKRDSLFMGGWLDVSTTGVNFAGRHTFYLSFYHLPASILEEVFKVFANTTYYSYLYSDYLRNNTVDWHLRTLPHSVYPIAKRTGEVHGSDFAQCIKMKLGLVYIFYL